MTEVHEIDAHVDEHLQAMAAAEAQGQKFNICQIYSGVRPVLKFARGLLFWKHKWQIVIDGLLAALDASCSITDSN